MNFAKFFAICLVLCSIAIPTYVCGSINPPLLPHTFYGKIMYGNIPIPIGSALYVNGTGVKTNIEGNPLYIENSDGTFGNQWELQLIAQGDIKPGTPLSIYALIDGKRYQVLSTHYVPGDATRITYTINTGSPTPTPTPTPTVTPTPEPTTVPLPPLPQAFYGKIMYGTAPIPVGSSLYVDGTGVKRNIIGNPIYISNSDGTFGNNWDTQLIAQGDIKTGTMLTVYATVNETKYTVFTTQYVPGEATEIKYTIDYIPPTPEPTPTPTPTPTVAPTPEPTPEPTPDPTDEYSSVIVSSRPSGALVYLENNEGILDLMGTTPCKITIETAGDAFISIKKTGYRTYNLMRQIILGEDYDFVVSLIKK